MFEVFIHINAYFVNKSTKLLLFSNNKKMQIKQIHIQCYIIIRYHLFSKCL